MITFNKHTFVYFRCLLVFDMTFLFFFNEQLKALYNLGLLTNKTGCPGGGIMVPYSALSGAGMVRLSCRCSISKHSAKMCTVCGPVCNLCINNRAKRLENVKESVKCRHMSAASRASYMANVHGL